MSKKNVRTAETKSVVSQGLCLLEDIVCGTMGPGGRNVILENSSGAPVITKDGVTVAQSVPDLEDNELNLIVRIIKESAEKTNREAGDGTTTSICLTHAIYNAGVDIIESNKIKNVNKLKKEIKDGVDLIIQSIDKYFKVDIANLPDEEKKKYLYSIANISLNGDKKYASLISDVVAKAGLTSMIAVEDGKGYTDELIKIEGMQFNKGWVSPYFKQTEQQKEISLDNPYIFMTTFDLTSTGQLGLLEKALNPLIAGGKQLLIIAPNVSGGLLNSLIANNKQKNLVNCAVFAPYYGNVRKEFMQDLAISTGATIIDQAEGHSLSKVEVSHFGKCERAIVTATGTSIIGGAGDTSKVKARINFLKEEAKKVNPHNDLDKVHERLAKIEGGAYVIQLANQSYIEGLELKHRIEDAVNACKGALEGGIVAGGGATLFAAAKTSLDCSIPGHLILSKACEAPMEKILYNIGVDFSDRNELLQFFLDKRIRSWEKEKESKPFSSTYTISEKNDKGVKLNDDCFATGVVDPAKVTKHALSNAASVSATLLTTNGIISSIPEVNPMPFSMY